MGKKEVNLSWDDFKKLGNPENAPEMPKEKEKKSKYNKSGMSVRIHLEKKGRAGKAVSIVKGVDIMGDDLDDLGKLIKKQCGVGGSVKDREIIIQGDHRDKIMAILKKEGYSNVKKAGG